MRRALLLAAAALLASACVRTELKFEPSQPVYELSPQRLAPIASIDFMDDSDGVESSGTGLILKRPFFDTFRAATVSQLAALGVPVTSGQGARVTVELTKVGLERGTGFFARLAATVTYVVRVRRGGETACTQEVTGWASRQEGVVSSPAAQTLQDALGKALDNLGPALAQSCLYAPESAAAAPAPAAVAAAPAAPAAEAVSAPLSDVDLPPGRTKIDPKLIVVAIGVERYRAGLPPASFAARDARAFAAYAKGVLGAADDNVVLLTDENATLADLSKYFERWLPNRALMDDKVLVYFSGHGAPDPRDHDAYLVPYDGDPAYLAQTAYPLARLYKDLGRLPVPATVVLDSCFSGAGGRSVIASGARPLLTEQVPGLPKNVAAVTAGAPGQIANSDKDKGHGLFTYYLLKELKAKGPDLRAAFDAAKPEVESAARTQLNADQTPQWRTR